MIEYTPNISAFKKLTETCNLVPIYRQISADLETPVSAFLKIGKGPYSFLFESVEGGENVARYSFIGTEPSKILITGDGRPHGKQDPLKLLKENMSKIKYASVEGLPKFHGGAVGYLAYDVISYFEPRVPPISDESSGIGLPESVLMFTDSLLIFDHVRNSIFVVAHADVTVDGKNSYSIATNKIESLIDRLESQPPKPSSRSKFVPIQPNKHIDMTINYDSVTTYDQSKQKTVTKTNSYMPNMSRETYSSMVEGCKKSINDGEIIQAVLSQRLTRPTTADPFDLYRSLRTINPSPYMFYLEMGDFQIVGASPELLVQVIDNKIAVHPIAGTRPRGSSKKEDDALERELLNDEKEIAEHVMLLDLGRNDVGRVSNPGTVRVTQQFEIERYSHVMHIVSHVTGDLSPEYDALDALKAAFPAGTVSGAPKIRAMELIAQYEPEKRGPYSGAIGYVSYTGNMDTAISLRTMVIKDGKAYLQAGGGIVADSNVNNEYEETLHKMAPLMRAIDHAEDSFG